MELVCQLVFAFLADGNWGAASAAVSKTSWAFRLSGFSNTGIWRPWKSIQVVIKLMFESSSVVLTQKYGQRMPLASGFEKFDRDLKGWIWYGFCWNQTTAALHFSTSYSKLLAPLHCSQTLPNIIELCTLQPYPESAFSSPVRGSSSLQKQLTPQHSADCLRPQPPHQQPVPADPSHTPNAANTHDSYVRVALCTSSLPSRHAYNPLDHSPNQSEPAWTSPTSLNKAWTRLNPMDQLQPVNLSV